MTAKSNLGSGDTLTPAEGNTSEAEEQSTPEPAKMPLPPGLSALIQAATSQLGQLAEQAPEQRRDHQFHSLSSKFEDGASSDGGERLGAPARTPPIIPEADPRKQSFPELLMTLAADPNNVDVIAFLPDGKFFAIRALDFSEDIMGTYFAVTNFGEFLELSHDWGFSRILQDPSCSDIQVFRHPQFIRGEWEKCARIKFGESPTDLRVSALPGRARIEYTLSDDSTASSSNTKRRLSPGFLNRRGSESSVSSQRQRKDSVSSHISHTHNEGKTPESEAGDATSCGNSRSDDVRSIALAMTTENLNLKTDSERKEEEHERSPLIERAVESATHTIVTDAIESLLRDECHTKETYLKHEKELSRSSLPGVVPISKQLFSPKNTEKNGEIKEASSEEVVSRPEEESLESSKEEDSTKADETTSELKLRSMESAATPLP